MPKISAYPNGGISRSGDQFVIARAGANYAVELFPAATTKTISGGVLTVDQTAHKVAPQSGTTDDIDTISGMQTGSILYLAASSPSTQTLTFKHGTGNLSCFGGSDISLTQGFIICFYDGTTVFVAGGGGGGGSGKTETPYRISVTVASNNLTIALKDSDGNDPSASSPIRVQIGDSVRTITSALSTTINAGTNWFNSGSDELATKEIDYFAVLVWDSADSAVRITCTRFPDGQIISDFNSTTTNEKHIYNYSTFTTTDPIAYIGRFAATLSAAASYNWSVPTFTSSNLIHYPIYQTRWLDFVPQWTNLTVGNGTNVGKYRIYGSNAMFTLQLTFGSTTSLTSLITTTLPVFVRMESTDRYSIGLARFNDSGTIYAGIVQALSGTRNINFVAQNASATYLTLAGISSTIPFTWATGDLINVENVVVRI